MVDKYLDKKLHDKIKREADKIFEKNSAYKSMYINKEYKKAGGKVKSDKKDNLSRWRRERWVNLSGVALGKTKLKNAPECGIKDKNQGKNPSICRPSVKVNKDTPKLAQNFSKSQLKKALDIKKKNKRIEWEKL